MKIFSNMINCCTEFNEIMLFIFLTFAVTELWSISWSCNHIRLHAFKLWHFSRSMKRVVKIASAFLLQYSRDLSFNSKTHHKSHFFFVSEFNFTFLFTLSRSLSRSMQTIKRTVTYWNWWNWKWIDTISTNGNRV